MIDILRSAMRALTPLEYLEKVMITLTDRGFGSTTLGHTPAPDVNPTPDPNLWAGECNKCKYKGDTFRQKWVDRKRGIGVFTDDDGKKDMRPPKLRRVEWCFESGCSDRISRQRH
jgi:hypothetical protein